VASPAILTLVRHGETSANIDGVWHGSTDSALTERGVLQAARVAAFLADSFRDAAALYTSPLQRARLTAAPIAEALGLAVRVDADLGEYDLGAWEGVRYVDLLKVHRFWEEIRRDPHFAPRGGESPRRVADRFLGALRRIAAQHPGERVLVVTHGGALSLALGELFDGDLSRWSRVMANGAVSELVLDPEPALLRFNLVDHLAGV
jgi:broad specificity phosphatase PhoE